MVAIINNNNNSAANNIVIIKNKDVRSESIDSFSSTIDVHATFDKTKQTDADVYDSPSTPYQFGLVNKGTHAPPQFDNLTEKEQLLRKALSSILVLDSTTSCPTVHTLLDSYNGHLVDIGTNLLEGLRNAAPSQLAARVGDYNENLFYEMREMDQDIGSIIRGSETAALGDDSILDSLIQQDIESFECSIRQSLQHTDLSYRGSFMQTEQTMYQPAHVDYDYPILQSYGKRLFLAFFPLTEEGAFLQLWQDPMKKSHEDRGVVEGTVVYIPYGSMFLVPSDTIHGGGFKRGHGGNLRFHLYIAMEDNDVKGLDERGEKEITLLDHPMNKYTEKHDRRRELCERFVDAKGLESLLGNFFDV
mmetsp:Transcript_28586/g.60964  ORF Transcript_28586/g.60964 Transcript_28586/m.60964 type:complete len:360 (-) Transcript_28586:69-1148(-)|eukprot:CAMPEP_0172313838 /NCGR_PEP_ID=MMETSP1058-20130122/21095_1 /TAXON_ID=83371 /ORGANISM="Detonula confervacea, Strain CCMP 353" /LENGTH=359 /DNA_ID=CAMNT_0013027559 /DNA_START=224 /DNA_END=1303 /DNA_ORIENTATION=+